MENCNNDIVNLICPSNPESRWVALDKNDKIISEGETPNEVIAVAKNFGDEYFIMFVPKKDSTYIF